MLSTTFRVLTLAIATVPPLLLGLPSSAQAPTPQLLARINGEDGYNYSHIQAGVRVGEIWYFVADDPANGRELWRTDGTATGTRIVRDLRPGPNGSNPRDLVTLEQTVVFVASDGQRSGIWATDGTPEGTRFIWDAGNAQISSLRSAAGRVFFTHAPPGHPLVYQRYSTDGTTAGTAPLGVSVPGMERWAELPGVAIFTVPANSAQEGIWRTDGTQAGTWRLLAAANPGELVALGGRVWFVAGLASSSRPDTLYSTDGTVAGTTLHHTFPTTQQHPVRNLTPFKGGLYLTALQGTSPELWRIELAGQAPPEPMGLAGIQWQPHTLQAIGTNLYFIARHPTHGLEPYRSDGTPNAHTLLAPLNAGQFLNSDFQMGALGMDPIITVREVEAMVLYRVDDLTGALTKISLLMDGSAITNSVTAWMPQTGAMLIAAKEDRGARLWKTDGTNAGTVPITPPLGQLGSGATSFAAVGTRAFFSAEPPLMGWRLWTSTGGPGGTFMSGQPPAIHGGPYALFRAHGEHVYFTGGDSVRRLWRTDRNGAGAALVPGSGTGAGSELQRVFALAPMGDALYAGAVSGSKMGLWRVGGSGPATLVRELRGSEGAPLDVTAAGPWVYFKAYDGGNHTLFRSDGTAAGTAPAFTAPNHGGQYQEKLTGFGDLLLFIARDPATGQYGLYRSDGSNAGTFALRIGGVDSDAGTASALPATTSFAAARTFAAFTVRTANALELWRTDGTVAGTSRVKQVATQPRRTARDFAASGDLVFFTVDDSVEGRSVWRTDGTSDGTFALASFPQSADLTLRTCSTLAEGWLYFAAYTPGSGVELWRARSDGSLVEQLPEIAPGPYSANPCPGAQVAHRLFLSANDGTGVEPWVLKVREPDTSPPEVTVRYSVQPVWSASWFREPVTVSWDVVDADGPILSTSGCAPLTFTEESAVRNLRCEATSEGGTTSRSVNLGVDRTAPEVTCPQDLEREAAAGSQGLPVTWTVQARDALSGIREVVSHPASGSQFALGATQVEVRAEDRAGNAASCTFNVRVVEPPPPADPALTPEPPPQVSGCGCASAGAASGAWLLGISSALALAARPRTRTRERFRPRA